MGSQSGDSHSFAFPRPLDDTMRFQHVEPRLPRRVDPLPIPNIYYVIVNSYSCSCDNMPATIELPMRT
jgi:hypothetical protein